jgi:hypothetical protein
MEGDGRRRLRSFALGGLVGAAGAIAAVQRASRSRRTRRFRAGPAAFEDAPCFLELVGEEAQRYREGGGEASPARRREVVLRHKRAAPSTAGAAGGHADERQPNRRERPVEERDRARRDEVRVRRVPPVRLRHLKRCLL